MKSSMTFIILGGLALANADCISDCESTAASDIGCDVSDVSGCFCQADFATGAKACLYENSDCGKTYVASFYESWNSACADVSATAAATATTSASATASASTSASADCVSTCESTAATELGCDLSDVDGCFCLADFATKAKACLYSSDCSSDVSTFYNSYNSKCADVSASSAAATSATTTAAAVTSSISSTPVQVANSTTTSITPVIANGAGTHGVPFGIAAAAVWAGVVALY